MRILLENFFFIGFVNARHRYNFSPEYDLTYLNLMWMSVAEKDSHLCIFSKKSEQPSSQNLDHWLRDILNKTDRCKCEKSSSKLKNI